MDSKLPKPSGLKRPATFSKTVIPMDRIKREATSTNLPGKQQLTASEPYRDLTNFQDPRGRPRAGSPDLRSTVQSRFKLRRSRSACDIAMFKRNENVVPAKMPRLNEYLTTNKTTKPARFGNTTATIAPSKTFMRGTALTSLSGTIKKEVGIAKKPLVKTVTAKTSAKTTSTATTGAAKPINKRIPPYDFKARYNDLLEKFKALKEKHQQKTEELENFENLPEQLQACQSELSETKDILATLTTENKSLSEQLTSIKSQLESVTTNFAKCKQQLEQLETKHEVLTVEHTTLCEETKEIKEKNATLLQNNEYLNEEVNTCKELLFQSNIERKGLHNDLMDLRGNIRVFCRVRPPLSFEDDKALCGWNYLDEATVEIVNHDLVRQNKQGVHTFNFDYVFHPGCRQEDIFEMVSPLIQSAMDGYNICIFAYGQTGSGKTYTMDGIESNVGVIPRTVDLIFQSIENYKHLGWEYTIKATFLEIYNEVLYDLLSNEQKDMEIRMAKNNKNEIYVSNITEETVQTSAHLRELMRAAKMNRATAATVGNERSSRSHAVTRIELIGYHAEKNEYSIGTINLVDLAGSESPKTSLRMTETKNINRSLSELTNVILALLQKQDHVPYRNSKLTHLLMPSLGGNSKTLMFINVAPFFDCYGESVKSLRFAASVNSCKVAKAKRNRYLNTSNSC